MSIANRTSMREYTGRVLAPWAPSAASNRAPFEPGPRGTMRRGAGGLVTAMLTVADATASPWVAIARSPAERERAAAGQSVEVPGLRGPIHLHYVPVEPEAYRRHYSVIANPLIWFLQHYLWDLTHAPVIDEAVWPAGERGYVVVNRLLAEKVVEVARQG